MGREETAESELLAQARSGSRSAFESLVALHQNRVFNLVYRNVHDEGIALDIAQDVFVQAWKTISQYDERAKFSTWLHRVAMNAVISHHRHVTAQKRGGANRPASLGAENVPDPSSDGRGMGAGSQEPHEVLQAREMQGRIMDAIQKLDDDYRQVVILRDVEGLAYEEIAEVLSINTGTVRSRLFRGREQLRAALADLMEE